MTTTAGPEANPIIFSGPMVRAILEGRKTMTRRVVQNVPPMPEANCHPRHEPRHPQPYLDAYCGDPKHDQNPRGMSRDWHWWQVDDRPGPMAFTLPWKPGDELWVLEQITLRVTDIKVERLQNISRADAIAEGVSRVGGAMLRWENWSAAEGQSAMSPELAFAALWSSLHGPGSWEANPWVAAISFERVE